MGESSTDSAAVSSARLKLETERVIPGQIFWRKKVKHHALLVGLIMLFSAPGSAQDTPYGSCSQRAEVYQARYESTGQSSDLVCFQKALEREMSGSKKFDCPLTAQHYQTAYEQGGNSSDLVCYQQALERELR